MTGESDSGRPLVLVADDDEDILALVSFRLDRAGYRVLSAPDGEQALELIVGRRPDLAVLDVRMPKLTGIDVIRKVRATKSLSELPMVLLSAGVEDENIASGFDAGADDYMKKPFSPQELLARVESILGRR
jgi:DNA-binding response OmpR family regulator